MPAKKQFLSPIPIKKSNLFQNACTIAGISSNQERSEENSCSFAGLMVVTLTKYGNFVSFQKRGRKQPLFAPKSDLGDVCRFAVNPPYAQKSAQRLSPAYARGCSLLVLT
ncbi:hypothetical protein ABE504_14530 [Paenibacillus oryzisoli]|uniref:hypothetical protein n=1 Tax=Paenibacillus oryzisoli TaxID=1850517 RepID=UPI003D2E3B51